MQRFYHVTGKYLHLNFRLTAIPTDHTEVVLTYRDEGGWH